MPKVSKVPSFERRSLVKVWKKFLHQIPREFRSVIRSHHNFVVFGDIGSGKTTLIQGLVEQSQDVYPFEMSWRLHPELQFYLGPKQIIQELAYQALDNRSTKFRKHLIRLWKRLFRSRDVTVVITYNPWSESMRNMRSASKQARLILGKIALLSEIRKAPIKVRLVLTHLDQIEGYLEFARFLKQQNITFNIPLTSNFENETLKKALVDFYETHLSLMITTVSAVDYIRILTFFRELPALFPAVEEYLRILISREPENSPVELSGLCFSSEMDPNTSFTPFEWKQTTPVSIFFKYPILKHQIAASFIVIVASFLVINNYLLDKQQLKQTLKGIEILELLQPASFMESIVSQIEPSTYVNHNPFYLSFLPRFFIKCWDGTQNDLVKHIRKRIFEPMLRKVLMENQSELKTIYLLGLIHATKENRLGQLIEKNVSKWADEIDMDKNLILTYVKYRSQEDKGLSQVGYLSRIDPDSPLTHKEPWVHFFSLFQEILKEPVLNEFGLRSIQEQGLKLLDILKRIKKQNLAFTACNLLEEGAFPLEGFSQHIQTLQWIEENRDVIEQLLMLIRDSTPAIPETKDLNISEFFSKVQTICLLREMENRSYTFSIEENIYTFESRCWVDLVVSHVVGEMVHNYIAHNTNTQGSIFFKNTLEIPDIQLQASSEISPHFLPIKSIPGRFSRLAYEKNVRMTSEKMFHLIETLPINMEDKNRFMNFLSNEIVSYVKSYLKIYEGMYQSCNLQVDSLAEFKTILDGILKQGSSFREFLQIIHYHTEIFSFPTPCVKNLNELNSFSFLNSIFTENGEEEKFYPNYRLMIFQLLEELKSKSFEGSELTARLTPAARIGLEIFSDSSLSYLNQMQRVLEKEEIPLQYQGPFIAPIKSLYSIGMKDLKDILNKLWFDRFEPQIDYLLTKFPFNSRSKVFATFDEVEKILSPQGSFWKEIKEIYGVVSQVEGGIWSPLKAKDLQISAYIYYRLNQLSNMTSLLWDSEGNPQPIRVNIKAIPFKEPKSKNPVIILSSVLTGKEFFRNFNQTPQWHTLKINWWESSSSAVVIELLNKRTKVKTIWDVKVQDTLWSFYELLTKAEERESNIWIWKIGNQTGSDMRDVSLCFESNPWNVFRLEKSED